MTAVKPLRVVSTTERKDLALARIKAVRTRPSTLAAEEFFSGDQHWKSLPHRIRRLVKVFENWVRSFIFVTYHIF
jgi:hypothetical protein